MENSRVEDNTSEEKVEDNCDGNLKNDSLKHENVLGNDRKDDEVQDKKDRDEVETNDDADFKNDTPTLKDVEL